MLLTSDERSAGGPCHSVLSFCQSKKGSSTSSSDTANGNGGEGDCSALSVRSQKSHARTDEHLCVWLARARLKLRTNFGMMHLSDILLYLSDMMLEAIPVRCQAFESTVDSKKVIVVRRD